MKLIFYFSVVCLNFVVLKADGDASCNNLRLMHPTEPCLTSNLTCIRKYFKDNSKKCQEATGAICDTLKVDKFVVFYPYFNLTGFQNDVAISGLGSGQVENFIVDYDTNIVQLTTSFKNLQIKAKSTYVYYQPNQEPLKFSSITTVTYPNLLLVTIFNSAKHLDLNNSFTLAKVVANPTFQFGRCITKSTNPRIIAMYEEFVNEAHIVAPEDMLTHSPVFQTYYLQRVICDFDFDTSSGNSRFVSNMLSNI